MSGRSFCRLCLFAPVFIVAMVLSGCDAGSNTVSIDNGQFSVPVPDHIRQIAALSNNQLEIQISVNGSVVRFLPVTGNDETVSTVVNMPAGQSNEITIAWFAIIGSQKVILADFTDVVTSGVPVLNVLNYNSSGERFDADNDGRTNLDEAIDNRNLLSPFDLEVPLLNSFGGTVAFITDDGVDIDTSGEPGEDDEDSFFRLRHDGTDLIVYLCGKDQTLIGDNVNTDGQYWHDDTVFIYLDGGDSNNPTYDQVDDFQFAFVRSAPDDMIVPNGKGPDNQFCPNGACVSHDFFNNSSACEYELTVTLPLNDLNIALDSAVGFDIEIVDDDNGGLREGSSSWIGFNDRSDLEPSTFGTIRLN